MMATSINPAYRIGKQFTSLTEVEIAKISSIGIIANILFAILLKIINPILFEDMILLNVVVAISYLLPLPGLDGIKIIFGSRLLYAMVLAFVLVSAFLLNFIEGYATLILGIIAAGVGGLIYLHHWSKN